MESDKGKAGCPNCSHRAEPLEGRVRDFAFRLIEDPGVLREQVERQVRAERDSKPWLRSAREAASARERLAKLDLVADNFRDQQAEGLVSMAKLDALAEERGGLEARLTMLADGEVRLRELEELPGLVEGYLAVLPELIGPEIRVQEYGTVPAERMPDSPSGVYTLTRDRITHLTDGELAGKRLAAEAARGARFRELYARLGFRAAVCADGAVEITMAPTNTKGVMPWDGWGSRSNTCTRT